MFNGVEGGDPTHTKCKFHRNGDPDGYFFTADTLAELAERIINPERVCIRPRPTTEPAPRSS